MAEYIERGELIANLRRFAPEGYSKAVELIVEKQPAADVTLVRHAHVVVNWLGDCHCSSCGENVDCTRPFCAGCGARLDEPEQRE